MENCKYYLLVLLCFILIKCQTKTKETPEIKDKFALIQYPEWVDSLDCDKFDSDIRLYPCLKLEKKTIKEVDSLYGEPIETRIDTLYYGQRKENKFYDPEISEMISNIPIAKVTFTYREILGLHLFLYFIDENGQDVVFWGEKIDRFLE